MVKLDVKSEKSGNFASESNSKPLMIVIESKKRKWRL